MFFYIYTTKYMLKLAYLTTLRKI